LHKPKVIILDEPTIGLDPTQIVEIRHLIKRLAENSTILFSSHILAEVEAVCDRVIMIMAGKVKADARLDELEATSNTILVLQHEVPDAANQLGNLPQVTAIEPFQTREGYPAYRVVSDADISGNIYDVARTHDWPLRELRHEVQTLESIFSQLAA
jgi:ABC-2 type transport system ATP-binding protein